MLCGQPSSSWYIALAISVSCAHYTYKFPRDTVSVNTSRGVVADICTDIEKENSYLNRPGGVILEDAKAQIEFCSNEDGMVCNHRITNVFIACTGL